MRSDEQISVQSSWMTPDDWGPEQMLHALELLFQASSRGCPTFGPLEKVAEIAEIAEIADVELNLHGLMDSHSILYRPVPQAKPNPKDRNCFDLVQAALFICCTLANGRLACGDTQYGVLYSV